MKKTLALLIGMSLGAGAVQADVNYEQLHRDAEIMANILHTSLKQGQSRKDIRYKKLEATYLAGQGLVFDVDTGSGPFAFKFQFGDIHIPDIVIPPDPPNIIFSGDESFEFEVHEEHEWEQVAREAVETAREALREVRGRMSDLREREREIAWGQRELEREMRDLEFEMRRADGEYRAELENRKTELRQRLDELNQRRAEVEKYADELEQEQKQQQAEQGKARQAAYQSFLAAFEDTVADTLCRYGASVRSMPKEEHVSFVLSNFGSAEQRDDKRDKIYVFSNKDITACVAEKFDKESLLKKMQTYNF